MKQSARRKVTGKPKANDLANRWGQARDPRQAWAKLERRGDTIVLAEPSSGTPTVQRHDYELLYWSIRQLHQYISQKRERDIEPTVEDVKKDFHATALCGDGQNPGYATDTELSDFLRSPTSEAVFAKSLIVRRWGMQPSSVESNIKPSRSKKDEKEHPKDSTLR